MNHDACDKRISELEADLATARYRITKLETAEREGRAYESELEAENARLLIELAAARTATTAPEDS